MSLNLQSAICGLQSAVCSLQSAVCSLQSAVCSLQSANVIHRLSVRSLLVYKLKPHKPYARLQETEKKDCSLQSAVCKCHTPIVG